MIAGVQKKTIIGLPLLCCFGTIYSQSIGVDLTKTYAGISETAEFGVLSGDLRRFD
jgi:hypothetical protein